MFEASLEGVLKFFLIFLFIYFGIKIIIRYFGPMILRYFMKRLGKNLSKRFYENQKRYQSQSSEPDLKVQKKPSNKRKKNKDVGEYIDYEEID